MWDVAQFVGTSQSYRQAMRQNGQAMVYDDRQDHPLARRGAALAHSTLWRWLSWLGGLSRTRQAANQLIDQADPHCTLHREVIPIDPRKYRSEARCDLLQQAGQLLLTEAVFHQRLGKKIFPTFATGCGWR